MNQLWFSVFYKMCPSLIIINYFFQQSHWSAAENNFKFKYEISGAFIGKYEKLFIMFYRDNIIIISHTTESDFVNNGYQDLCDT